MFSYFDKIDQSQATGIRSLDEVIAMITTPDQQTEEWFDEIRSTTKGSPEYKKLKEEVPACMFNTTTNGGCKMRDCLDTTGYLFLDVDNVPSDEVEVLKSNLAASFPSHVVIYRSTGGRGINMVLSVSGLDATQFKGLASFFSSSYPQFNFDPAVFTLNRKSFIAHDVHALVNQSPIALDLSSITKGIIRSETEDTTCLRPNDTFFKKLRFNNDSDFFVGKEDVPYLYFKDKVGGIQVDGLWVKVSEGGRNMFLFRNMVRIIHLNPWLSEAQLLSFGLNMNRRMRTMPLDKAEVRKIVGSAFRGKDEYKPQFNTKRMIIHNPLFKKAGRLRRKESTQIQNRARGEVKSQLIYEWIESYTGKEKLTAKLVSTISGIPLITVKRHWKEFKDYVKAINRGDKMSEQPEPVQYTETIPPSIVEEPVAYGWEVYTNQTVKKVALPIPMREIGKGDEMLKRAN